MTNKLSFLYLLILLAYSATLSADTLRSLTKKPVWVCDSLEPTSMKFQDLDSRCDSQELASIDPQLGLVWIVISFTLDDSWQLDNEPLGLYIMGKASSRIYLNGKLVGNNGTPANEPQNELPGYMDSVFFLPRRLLKSKQNYIVLEMSSQHGYLHLGRPLHFIGLARYGEANRFVQQFSQIGLVLSGIFLLASIYYLTLCFNLQQRKHALIFFFMSILLAGQLFAEIFRGLFQYSYPIHDLRLLLVTGLSLGFGICVLFYISRKYQARHYWHWTYSGVLLTITAVLLSPGFDAKTGMATLIPSCVAIVILGIEIRKTFKWSNFILLLSFLFFALAIIVTRGFFHEILFYVFAALFMCYLFVLQAKEFSREQSKRQHEKELIAKLEYKLDQRKQQTKPASLSIHSSGKLEKVMTSDIVYGKASGDYVELYLKENRQTLYSGSLKNLLEQLPNTFIKVHRSFIVNLDSVQTLESESGTGSLLLNDRSKIPVSRRMMPKVRESLQVNYS
ncbi:LytR/AlgR family response regulator transcription factor [Pleionea sediminis]|uniref:LytR/AlgR family response regulator transcription factor n=1 Tax=Pleionea sediminis TaxID=2569479 RepID=UPI0011858AFF|nr:LytTR family DNA-binding domain-containing protein [Pleionea sediminis]